MLHSQPIVVRHSVRRKAVMNGRLTNQTIGFIGLGNMGALMARHLQTAGADVVVWNRSDGPAAAAVADGLRRAYSPRDLGKTVGDGVVCVNLTETKVVEQVVFGSDGLAECLGQNALVIDFGTTSAIATKKFAELLHWIDAPVSGGQVGAKNATLSIMVGGLIEDFQRSLPILQVIGKRVTHLGPSGAGQVTKLVNQLIVAQTIDAVAQALRLAELAGVGAAAARQAMLGGFADSRILDLHGERIANRDFVAGGRAALQLKDVRLICELAESVGFQSSTLANSLGQWITLVDEMGLGHLDHSALYKLYE